VSTATKNKLSNFLAKTTDVEKEGKAVISLLSSDEKENLGNGARQTHTRSQLAKEKNDETERSSDPPKKTCPSTPASRLALPDLIGMSDVERAVETISPDDRVEWDYSKDSSQDSTPFQGIRRANKRARSSSPLASSPAYGKGEQPQLDPGSELWGRYSLNGPNTTTSLGPSVPALAHLMQTSSPQPARNGTTPRTLSSFRRANSCGTTFPKRRRVGGSDGDVFTESANIGPSRLSVLIERVQEGMSQLKPVDECSSRALGSQKRALSSVEEGISNASRGQHRESSETLSDPASRVGTPRKADNHRQERQASVQTDYGDFDDDALDSCVLDALESKAPGKFPLEVELPVKPPSAPARQPSRSPRKTSLQVLVDEESYGINKGDEDVDEFGDFDDDVFGDLEQVVSQFDTEVAVMKPDKASFSAPPPGRAAQEAESEDEFGDDGIDENDFEAAVAATQSLRKSNDLLPVRTRYS
jgi:hypothetical protein